MFELTVTLRDPEGYLLAEDSDLKTRVLYPGTTDLHAAVEYVIPSFLPYEYYTVEAVITFWDEWGEVELNNGGTAFYLQ